MAVGLARPVFRAASAHNSSMAAKEIQWDRNKLYDEIWEKPAIQVAKEYGISDVGLGKVCRQLNIPKPERGYWRRKELGLKVQRIPLPAMDTVPRAVSVIYEREPAAKMSASLEALVQLEATAERRIALPNELGENLHPLVKKTLSALQRGKANQEGYLQPRAACLDVTITTQQLERAAKVMEAVVRGLVERGHRISVNADSHNASVAFVNGERLVFGLKEKVARRDRELSPPSFASESRTHTATGLTSTHTHPRAT